MILIIVRLFKDLEDIEATAVSLHCIDKKSDKLTQGHGVTLRVGYWSLEWKWVHGLRDTSLYL